jgi:hypothetical protein
MVAMRVQEESCTCEAVETQAFIYVTGSLAFQVLACFGASKNVTA